MQQEEIIWIQNSKVQWLKEGERNTEKNLMSMIHHMYKNRIIILKNDKNKKLDGYENIK